MKIWKAEQMIKSYENIYIDKIIADENSGKIHKHDFFEFVYIMEGSGTHFIDNHGYAVKKGDMLFVNFSQTHSFKAQGSLTYINFLMKPEFISRELINTENVYDVFSLSLFDEFEGTVNEDQPIVHFSTEEIKEVEAVIQYMLVEFQMKQAGYKSKLGGYMRVIFSMLIRKLQKKPTIKNASYLQKITPDILNYIDKNCCEKISLSALAEKCFYNPSYFSRVFKQYCGETLTGYIQKKRIEKAELLLCDTDLPIEKICENVGYIDKAQFYKIFKEKNGITPNQYRKEKVKKSY